MNISKKPKIALCFFGITRSLRFTIASIRENVLLPASDRGEVCLFGHFFDLEKISNIRSSEDNILLNKEYDLLDFSNLELDSPNIPEVERLFEFTSGFGDHWGDGLQSLRNLCHQLYSLSAVTRAATKADCDIFVFCRPDLMYLDSLDSVYDMALGAKVDGVWLPNWQCAHGGYNDRFAVCCSRRAAEAYGLRHAHVEQFCSTYLRSLHSELLLKSAMRANGISVWGVPNRAVRMRATGLPVSEEFGNDWRKTEFSLLRLRIRSYAKRILFTVVRGFGLR
ncbi:hypothetical protein [Amorphus sp. 3PC139-8]|uniref:hypothetical protein n=1 Tax=Amorphus sp. 3PC139-8 TaxID=2735676 RepID=UPI00345C6AEC